MKLDRIFTTTEWTEERLAAAVGVDQSTINRLRREERNAGVGLVLRIEEATEGMVKAADLPMTKKARRDLMALQVLHRRTSGTARDAAA